MQNRVSGRLIFLVGFRLSELDEGLVEDHSVTGLPPPFLLMCITKSPKCPSINSGRQLGTSNSTLRNYGFKNPLYLRHLRLLEFFVCVYLWLKILPPIFFRQFQIMITTFRHPGQHLVIDLATLFGGNACPERARRNHSMFLDQCVCCYQGAFT